MYTHLQLSKRLERNDRERQRLSRAQWRILGARMKEARMKEGVGLRELARCMGISAPFLSDMEKGARHYTPTHVQSAFAGMIKARGRAKIPPMPFRVSVDLPNGKFRDTAGT